MQRFLVAAAVMLSAIGTFGMTSSVTATDTPVGESPEYEPTIEVARSDCQAGDIQVGVTTTTTTYLAVWDGSEWVKTVDDVDAQQRDSTLNAEEVERCAPVYPPLDEPFEEPCQPGDDFVSFGSITTFYEAEYDGDVPEWNKIEASGISSLAIRTLTEEEQETCAPPNDVTSTEWVDGVYTCDNTTVEQTRTVTTTTYSYVEDLWVASTPIETTETRTRALAGDEVRSCLTTTVPDTSLPPIVAGDGGEVPAATTTPEPSTTLPATGSDAENMLALGMGLLFVGVGLSLATRRRPPGWSSGQAS